jgi:hypothetical protein
MSGVPNTFKVILLVLVAICWVPLSADAVCMACWSLTGVRIELRNGQKLEGYVTWNELWVEDETQTPLPNVLLEPLKGVPDVQFYEELHRINYPVQGLIVSAKAPMTIELDSLKSVVLRPDSLDGSNGADDIPVVSMRMIERLKREKPIAYCIGEGSVSDIYWVSYNSDVDEKALAVLCNEPWLEIMRGCENLEENDIVRFEIGWD